MYIKKIQSYLVRLILIVVVFLDTSMALAENSPLCSELARFACAPGSYKDGTGESRSESEVNKLISSYAEKYRIELQDRFQKLLDHPENSYFKDLTIAGLGLKNSPQCNSSKNEDIIACKESLIGGLTILAQKQALGSLMPGAGLARAGNLKDLNYIVQNNKYQKVIKDLNDQVQKDLSAPVVTKKIQEKIFPNVKRLIIGRLKKISVSDEHRKLMIDKINSISFEGASCDELSGGAGKDNGEIVSALLAPNAFYDPMRNIFKLCAGLLLQSTSEFMIVGIIAHELSHSIDPCSIALGPVDIGFKYSNSQDIKKMESEYPIKNIVQCLRDPRSIGARNFSTKKGESDMGDKIQSGDGSLSSTKKDNADKKRSASFCENDQIGESFSDWMAAEILPKYMESNFKLTTDQYRNGYANIFRLNCSINHDEDKVGTLDVHPYVDDRINKIILVNPNIRSQMGCSTMHPEHIYCDSEKSMNSSSEGFGCVACMSPSGSRPSSEDSTPPRSKQNGGVQ